jgi:hypothetical protein
MTTVLSNNRADAAEQCRSSKRRKISYQNGQTKICDQCQQINFSAVVELSWEALQSAGQEGCLIAELGTRLDFIATSCDVCRALRSMLLDPSTTPQSLELRAYSTFGRARKETFRLLPAQLKASDLPHLAVVASTCKAHTLNTQTRYAFCLPSSSPHDRIFAPQVPPSNIDYTEIKSWLEYCKKAHKSLCNKDVQNTRPSRLIDCGSSLPSLVQATQSMVYLALSYTWGCPGSENSTALAITPQTTLLSQISTPAKTIRDAIHVTRELGFRYLWVDSICIDQASDEDKSLQIHIMDEIYGGAELTIVAAAGTSKEFGLPGVSTTPRTKPMPTVNVGNVQIVCTERNPQYLIRLSKWAQRAWTFQEALISRRLLYFTEHETYFECHSMQIRESMRAQWKHLHCKQGKFYDHLNSGLFLGRLACNDSYIRAPRQSLFRFYELVQQYTRREMTNETDSLSAFQGIMQHLQRGSRPVYQITGVPYLFYPESAEETHNSFLISLLWVHENPPRRKKGLQLPHPTRRHFLPSWSWAGWKGYVNFVTRTDSNTKYGKFEVLARITHIEVEGANELESRKILNGSKGASAKLPHALLIKTRLLRPDTYSISFNDSRPLCRITSKLKPPGRHPKWDQSRPVPSSRQGRKPQPLRYYPGFKGELYLCDGPKLSTQLPEYFASNGLEAALLATHPGFSRKGRKDTAMVYFMILKPEQEAFTRLGLLQVKTTLEDLSQDIMLEERLIKVV